MRRNVLSAIIEALNQDLFMRDKHRKLLQRAANEITRLRKLEDREIARLGVLARFEEESG